MTDFKALRDKVAWKIQCHDECAHDRDLNGTITIEIALKSLLFEQRNTILAALDLADKVSGLQKAAINLRDDLLERAEWDGDAKVVVAGAGAWFRFCQALQGDDNGQG